MPCFLLAPCATHALATPTPAACTHTHLWPSLLFAASELEPQLQHSAALVQDAERRVADKQRAFNLLHADFAKQKAEAAEAADKAAQLQTQ